MAEKSIQDRFAAERLKGVVLSPMRQIGEMASALRQQGKPVIAFNVGEPDFGTPRPIIEAVKQKLDEGYTHYTSNRGVQKFRQAIAEKTLTDMGLSYDPETEIIVTCGGAEAIHNTLAALINPGDEVIIPSPAFINYDCVTRLCGGVPVPAPLTAENGFLPDAETIERVITPRTKAIIINNPNNPTGVVYSKECLANLAELAEKYDFLVISDEIYSNLVYDNDFCSFAALTGMRERSVVVNGFSKTYAMTGWRVGYTLAPRWISDRIIRVHQYSSTTEPTFIQEGLAISMNETETLRDIAAMKTAFDRRRKLSMAALDDIPGVTYVKPEGAFYIMIDVSGTGMEGEAFAARLLQEKYVAMVPAVKLGAHCVDYLRFSYATSDENILEGLSRMKEFAEELLK